MAASVLPGDGPRPVEPVRPRRPVNWPLAGSTALLIVNLLLGGWAAFDLAFMRDLPPIPGREELWAVGRPPGATFVGPDGKVVAYRGPRHGQAVKLAELPAHVPLAFLAIEDRRFYQHGPVDLRAIARAAWANQSAGHTVEGGSTLSQQLARTLFLKPEKTLRRKVQETLLAARLEAMLSKDEVLELYLNRIYFGDRAYGISAAAQTYFGKPASELTLSEAALLAALPRAPSKLAPSNDPAAAWARARLVLEQLAEMDWIDPTTARAAAAGPPPAVVKDAANGEGDMGWALDAAQAQALALVGDEVPDLVIHLTVDPAAQAKAATILRRAMAGEGRARGARQAALVAMAPDGAIRAMVGGVDRDTDRFNRVIQARRQPGSAIKPIVWAAALEHGVRPLDHRSDAPIRIGAWRPQNYGGGYRGEVSVQAALAQSINTISVRLARETGFDEVGALARRFGLAETPVHPLPSLALGAYEVSLLQLASAYQVLQTGGGQSRPYLISAIADARGRTLYQRQAGPAIPVYPVFESAQMVRMMQGVITSGTARGAGFGRPAAGKTGTSQDHRDAWFVGFTPDWLCAVWVGNDDNRPMARVTGGQIPADIWRRFMVEAHRGLPVRGFDWFPAILPPDAPAYEPPRPPIIPVRHAERARSPDSLELADVATREPDVWSGIPY
ncbi:transglycosylase domain-containing protein [Phenylobacterium sp.]|uniref:transglycosylase domain-containing protein n=1 Tax=Phenylobacterium sp. TaxID=1871053 RepID=UPI00273628A7|nr:PBP1A family penicillin-binding protein [Phenylobacterium sp.]MDP3854508.1 PBP1A family penicillin-binding protein [Phenylobacterium sp.]